MMKRCAVDGVAAIGQALGIRVEFGQRAGQSVRIAGEMRARSRRPGIRASAKPPAGSAWPQSAPESSSAARQGLRRDARRDRSCRRRTFRNARLQISDRSGDGRRDRTDQDVAIVDVAEFVRQHAFEFLIIEQIQNPLGHCDRSVLADCARSRKRSANRWESRRSSASECPIFCVSRSTTW